MNDITRLHGGRWQEAIPKPTSRCAPRAPPCLAWAHGASGRRSESGNLVTVLGDETPELRCLRPAPVSGLAGKAMFTGRSQLPVHPTWAGAGTATGEQGPQRQTGKLRRRTQTLPQGLPGYQDRDALNSEGRVKDTRSDRPCDRQCAHVGTHEQYGARHRGPHLCSLITSH